jgi:hypothetical protein
MFSTVARFAVVASAVAVTPAFDARLHALNLKLDKHPAAGHAITRHHSAKASLYLKQTAPEAVHHRSKQLRHLAMLSEVDHSAVAADYDEYEKSEIAKTMEEKCKACEAAENEAVDAFEEAAEAHKTAQQSSEELTHVKNVHSNIIGDMNKLDGGFNASIADLIEMTEKLISLQTKLKMDESFTGTENEIHTQQKLIDVELARAHTEYVRPYVQLCQEQLPAAEADVEVKQTTYDTDKSEAETTDSVAETKKKARDDACAFSTPQPSP